MGEFGLSRISIVDAEAWLRNALEKLGHRFVDGGDPVYAKDSIDVTLKLAWTRASATARATNVVVGLLPAGGEVVEYFRRVNTSMGLSESATALKGSFDTALSRALQKAGLASTEGC